MQNKAVIVNLYSSINYNTALPLYQWETWPRTPVDVKVPGTQIPSGKHVVLVHSLCSFSVYIESPLIYLWCLSQCEHPAVHCWTGLFSLMMRTMESVCTQVCASSWSSWVLIFKTWAFPVYFHPVPVRCLVPLASSCFASLRALPAFGRILDAMCCWREPRRMMYCWLTVSAWHLSSTVSTLRPQLCCSSHPLERGKLFKPPEFPHWPDSRNKGSSVYFMWLSDAKSAFYRWAII